MPLIDDWGEGSDVTPRGYARFASLESPLQVLVRLGNGPAQITGGVGGWELEERFGLAPVPVWSAPDVVAQTVPILFDGAGAETGIRRLRRLGAPQGRRRRPPLLKIDGRGLHDLSKTWVITDLDPDDDVRRYGDHARRHWQPYVVTLWHHPAFSTVRRSPSKVAGDKAHGSGRGSRPKTYTVKKGDRLSEIAKRLYGDARKWREIAEANKLRDPRHLKVGQKLRIP